MQKVSRLHSLFNPSHYALSLELDRRARSFRGSVSITGETSLDDRLRLHSKDLMIESVLVDNKAATFSAHANDELEITQANLGSGQHDVTIRFSGVITDQMHGLYPCYFTHQGEKKELLATQFESHHAREVFPCVDEPSAKATFAVSLTTETGLEVLGNMPITSQQQRGDQLVTSFETTPRMSTYLLAWVVGELHKKTATTKSGVEVNVWATPAQPLESLDFALDIATRSIDFYDDYFGVPYPLPKADHVALPDFSSGAMENWGLITYREVALLADPANTSVSAKHYIATVIAHELAHQWFGNLVTMQWWNDLWLNESFATLMEYIAVDALEPEWNVWLDFSSNESVMALRRDAIDGVQSVQVDVNHPDEISTLFDGAIVYAKGARLLRMLETFVGKDAFRTGLGQYFKTHAYANTAADNLWQALSDASGKDIGAFMTSWISQPGYPVVSLDDDSLSQQQFFIGEHAESHRLWPVPLGANVDQPLELLETERHALQLPLEARLNQNDSAHFITKYSTNRLEAITATIADQPPLSRLQLLHEQSLLARGGFITSAELLPLLLSYEHETAESVWDIMALTIAELRKFVETDATAEAKLRELTGRLARPRYEALGWDEIDGEPETNTKLRATILGLMLYSEDADVVSQALSRFEAIPLASLPSETRSLHLSTVVKHAETPKLITDLLDTYASTSSVDLKQDINAGLSATK